MRHAMIAVLIALGVMGPMAASPGLAKRIRPPAATREFQVDDHKSLAGFEIEISDTSAARPVRAAVSDAMLIVAALGGDAGAALERRHTGEGASTADLINLRLFVVAGGLLYHQGVARCRDWDNDVARCRVDCDGSEFNLRRNGSTVLELDLRVNPGGTDGAKGRGVALSACTLDGNGEVRLVSKSGRGLAVIRFESEAEE